MRRTILALAVAALILAGLPLAGRSTTGSGTTYTQPAPIASAQNYCAAATTCSVSLTNPAPSVGDTVRCDVTSANAGGTASIQTGFTAIGTGPGTTGIKVQSYQRVVANGDATTYAFGYATAQNLLVNCTWFHFAASPGVFSTIGTAAGTSVTTLAPPTVTANTPSVLPVEVVAQAAASISTTDATLPNTLWTKNGAALSAQELTLAGSTVWPNLAGVSGAPHFSASANSVAEILIVLPAITPFTVAVVPAAAGTATPTPGGTATPSPTPPPVSGPPPQRDVTTWWYGVTQDNKNATTAQVAQRSDWCVGQGKNANGLSAQACPKSFVYESLNMGQPPPSSTNSSGAIVNGGADTDFPFHVSLTSIVGRTCPAPATQGTGLWRLTGGTYGGNAVPDYTSTGSNNWLVWPVGGSQMGTAPGAGVAQYKTSTFVIFTNVFSPGLLAYTNAVIGNCVDQYGEPLDSFTGDFEDNTFVGKESLGWSAEGGYTAGRNFGPGASSPYDQFTCGTGFQGVFSTGSICQPPGSAQIESTTMLIPTYPQETSFKTGMAQAIQAQFHCGTVVSSACQSNGAPWLTFYNGWNNTDNTLTKQSHTIAAMWEEGDVGAFGACTSADAVTWGGTGATDATKCITGTAVGNPYGGYNIMNDTAALYNDDVANGGPNPGIEGLLLADEPDAGTYALGTGDMIHDLLWHYGFMIAGTNDADYTLMNSMMNFCGGTGGGQANGCYDVWPMDYVQPQGRYTAWPAEPTGAGGATPCGNDWHSTNKNGEGTGTECTIGGHLDPAIRCGGSGGPANVYCFEWQHFWVYQLGSAPCTVFDRTQWSNCVVDIGPAAMIINNSGAAQTLSTANLSAWWPNTWSQLSNGFVLWPCTPSSAFGTAGVNGGDAFLVDATKRCSGVTGDDVGNGGNFDHTTPISTVENLRLLDTDVLIVTNS